MKKAQPGGAGGMPPRPGFVALKTPGSEEELRFVDADIADAFRKIGNYIIGTPTAAQASREIRKLREAIERERPSLLARLFGGRRG